VTEEQILALRPGDPIQAIEAREIEGADGIPAGVERVVTTGYWNLLAINHLRARIGAPLLPGNWDDEEELNA
jgi:hypothetical protein